MIVSRIRNIAFLVIIFPSVLMAQVDIKLSGAVDSVGIGESIPLRLEVNVDPGIKFNSLEISAFDSIGLYKYLFPEDTTVENTAAIDFEISDYGQWNNINANLIKFEDLNLDQKDLNSFSNALALKFWDVGAFLIVVKRITYLNKKMEEEELFPDFKNGLMIMVFPPGTSDQGPEMMPIKDILKEGRHWMDYKWLYVFLVAMALTIFLISRPWRKRRKIKKEKEKIIIVRPAHEIAFERLIVLKDKSLWQKGEIKAFQSELSFIIREYLENRYKINALEKTTDEIVEDLSSYKLAEKDIDMLRELLQIADLVKFAKAKPDEDIHAVFFEKAKTFVDKTKIEKEIK